MIDPLCLGGIRISLLIKVPRIVIGLDNSFHLLSDIACHENDLFGILGVVISVWVREEEIGIKLIGASSLLCNQRLDCVDTCTDIVKASLDTITILVLE